jgi:hypothetical protein
MATFLGNKLWEQCRASFGYLQTQGYCAPGSRSCHKFPILIGEVGSAFETAADKQWLQDFADFVNAEVGGAVWWQRSDAVIAGHRIIDRCVCSFS